MRRTPTHAVAGLRLDCRHYRGDRPCAAGVNGACPADCARHAALGPRILIIKLGALGDVIRTAALLPGLKESWPASHITWVSRPAGVRVLANHPLIDRRLAFDAESVCHLEHERFDLCLGLDKEPGPAALAMRVDARERRGIGLGVTGTPYPLNAECMPYFLLGLDDELKFRGNTKSYPELIYEAVGLRYRGQRFRLYPSPADQARAAECWQRLGVTARDVVIGLNTGAGRGFANKNWPPERFAELSQRLGRRGASERRLRVALFGGPDERERNAALAAGVPGLIDTGSEHTELEFAALVARCQVLVTGDTMAMHAALAADVPCVVLFGPTCPQEIDLYGRGERIVTPLACSPCYRRTCDRVPSCMDAIPVARVLAAVQRCTAPGERSAQRDGAPREAPAVRQNPERSDGPRGRVHAETEASDSSFRVGRAPRAARVLRVLVVAGEEPWPLDSGGRLHLHHVLAQLARRVAVTLLLPESPRWPERLPEGVDCQVACDAAAQDVFPGYARAHLPTALPLRLAARHFGRRPALAVWLRAHAHPGRFDVALLNGAVCGQYIGDVRVPAVWNPQDELVLYTCRAAEHAGWTRRLAALRRAALYAAFERHVARRAAATVFVSPVDARTAQRWAGRARFEVIQNGVDTRYFTPAATPPEPGVAAFVGALDFPPNIDGITHFARHAWPRLLLAGHARRLLVVGRNPTPAVQRLATLHGVEIVGTVPDVRPYLARAAVVIVPVRQGGGLKNKVLEACAMCRPVVASPRALAGLSARPGIEVLAAGTSSDWVAAVDGLLADSAAATRMAERGHAWVCAAHRWEDTGTRFHELLAAAAGKPVTGVSPEPGIQSPPSHADQSETRSPCRAEPALACREPEVPTCR